MKSKRLKKICFWVLAAAVAAYGALVLAVAWPRHFVAQPACAIIVLGHSIDTNKQPSPWLELRLEAALDLYKQGLARAIIVSGGQGPTDPVSVAYVMANWLVARGVADSSIILEDAARNTYQNFKYSYQLAEYFALETIIIATNDFHVFRAMHTARIFFDNVSAYSAPVPYGLSRLGAIMREPFSIVKLIFDHLLNTIF